MLAADRCFVIDTFDDPPVTVVVAVAVLFAVSPPGRDADTWKAALIDPETLATAGTVSAGALTPTPSAALRVHVIEPEQSGYPVAGAHDQPVPVGTFRMHTPAGTVNEIECVSEAASASGPLLRAVTV